MTGDTGTPRAHTEGTVDRDGDRPPVGLDEPAAPRAPAPPSKPPVSPDGPDGRKAPVRRRRKTEPPRAATETSSGRRLDIQGMRAVAIILVVLAHAEVPFFEGGFIGVDVFFLLSGFLITGLLLREVEKSGTLSFFKFYARRARRLLPLAALVLLFIAAGSSIILPPLQQADVGGDIAGAALYCVNWVFGAQQVDYFTATDDAVSPVRHFWSLSIEEQFYFVWPMLMLTATVAATRLRREPRKVILAVMVPIALGSVIFSIYLTGANPELAYFSTFTRIWELALGAILAIAAPPFIRMTARASDLLVGAGLVAIVGSAVLITTTTPYPGSIALVPVLGAALVLFGGASVARGRVSRVLLVRPMQHVGDISYGLYLWHWPFIVFATAIWTGIGTVGLLASVGVALIVTELTHYTIEKPIHESRRLARIPRRVVAVGAASTIAVAVVGLVYGANRIGVSTASADVPGAALIKDGKVPIQDKAEAIAPALSDLTDDRGQAFNDGCLVYDDVVESGSCTYGDPDSKTSVIIFGDSRALQYFAGLEPIAIERGWKLVVLTRGECAVADVEMDPRCESWREDTLRRIETEEDPDLVVVGTADKYVWQLGLPESLPMLVDGMTTTLKRLQRTGSEVVVMQDQSAAPYRLPETPGDCIAENPDDLSKCAWEPAERESHAFELMAAERVGAPTIDTQTHVCRPDLCPLVMGDVAVLKDGYHFSATFLETLSPWLEKQLARKVDLDHLEGRSEAG